MVVNVVGMESCKIETEMYKKRNAGGGQPQGFFF